MQSFTDEALRMHARNVSYDIKMPLMIPTTECNEAP